MITKVVPLSTTDRPSKRKAEKNLFIQMAEDKKAILEELTGKEINGKSALVNIVDPFKK